VRALNFIEPGKLDWLEAHDPAIAGDGEAVVRPLAVATCDIDAIMVRGVMPLEAPFAFGHECVAEVTEVGDAVSTVKPGDLVSVPFQISCGECEQCRAGHTGNCASVPRLSTYGMPFGEQRFGGFLSDAAHVPYADAMLVPVPGDVDPATVASLSDNIPDAWRTVAPPLEEAPGAPVLICIGAGSIALYAVALAPLLGAERVDVVGGRPEERELAAKLGANLLDEEFPERISGGYPITVDASGKQDGSGLACALRSTAPEGICTSIGIYYSPDIALPLLEIYTKGITFKTGRCHARPDMPAILELVREGKFDPAPVTMQTVSWDHAAEALSELKVKTVVTRAG
jgi:threonine dehydrogenase-like Zn-dependent dehydrogenase